MMKIVVIRKSSLNAESFARTMASKKISFQRINTIKALMLNQFRGYINQLTGMVRKPEKRYWVFADGIGGGWRFDFVVYPVQQLVIITAFYAVAIDSTIPQRQKRNAPRVQTHENKSYNFNNIRLTETDFKYIVSEVSRGILKERTLQYPKIGDYTVVPDMGSMVHCSDSLKNFGFYRYMLMYFSKDRTYCLMQREDNEKYFFAEIVDAPELGEKRTKWVPVPTSNIPTMIFQDAQRRLRE